MHHDENKSAEPKQINLQEIGDKLITEISQDLTKAAESAKLAEGAIKGIQLFFQRIMETQNGTGEQPSQPESEAERTLQ